MNEYMTFSQALEKIKQGERVCRLGWNGKDIFAYLNKGSRDISDGAYPKLPEGAINVFGIPFHLFEMGDTGTGTRNPSLCLKTAQNTTTVGWTPSQTDMLAEDWMIYHCPSGDSGCAKTAY